MMPLWTSAMRSRLKCGCALLHGGRAVRGPARVRDAGEAFEMRLVHLARQLGHAAHAARALEAAVGMHRDAARVVAAIFEPLQALNEDGGDVARGDCADDSTHGLLLQNRDLWSEA